MIVFFHLYYPSLCIHIIKINCKLKQTDQNTITNKRENFYLSPEQYYTPGLQIIIILTPYVS